MFHDLQVNFYLIRQVLTINKILKAQNNRITLKSDGFGPLMGKNVMFSLNFYPKFLVVSLISGFLSLITGFLLYSKTPLSRQCGTDHIWTS